MPQTLPNIPLSRSALLGVLATIQNGPTFAHQDIMSFAGMCSTAEVSEHVMACFGRLTAAEKGRALVELQSRLAPVPDYRPAMVPQPCQQQQAQAGAPVWIKATETRRDLTLEHGRVLGSVEKKVGQWHADMVSAVARSPSTRIMLGAYPYEAEARLVVEEAVEDPPPSAPRRETTAEWGARMDRESPRTNEKLRIPAGHVESLAIRAMDARSEECGVRHAQAQNAVRAKHNITDAPALAGRYGKAA